MIPRPTLADIVRRNEAELVLETASQPLRRNLFTPLARALSGAEHGLYGHQDWVARQIHPQSCDDDTLLEVFVPIYLPAGRKPPSAAGGVIKLSGAAGYPIAAGELLGRGDDAQFVLVDGVTLPAAGQITAKVIATAPGQAGNTEPGSKLRLVNTVPGVNGEAEVLAPGLSGGADIEGIEEVRARVIEARRNGGQVGRTTDWEIWAKEVAGVTRAWAAPKLLGNGSISVYFVRDGDADMFPDAAEQAAVLAHLEQTGTPMGEIYALAPINKPVNFTIRLTPDTPEIRQAVTEAVAAVLANEAAPVKRADGRTSVPVSGVTIPRSHLTEAISGAPGEWDHQLVAPAADVVCGIGELATKGTITWL